MNKFALIGAAGYIAPRHMEAISATGNDLIAAFDKNDSVGIIDRYFPEAGFFVEFERFDRYLDKLRRKKNGVDYIAICSPNYLHDAHMRFSLRSGANVICEKPLVVNPWNLDGLVEMEKDTGGKINTILQLRLHSSIIALRKKMNDRKNTEKVDVDLTYITSRGRWYLQSWKGDPKKSGGIACNIGVHFFDMLHFLFGELQENKVHHLSETQASGYLEYEKARVRWFLSLEISDVPAQVREAGQRTYRSITVEGEEIEFSGGFTDLHIKSYEKILEGKGFGVEDNRVAIDTVATIRHAAPEGLVGDYHPFLKNVKT